LERGRFVKQGSRFCQIYDAAIAHFDVQVLSRQPQAILTVVSSQHCATAARIALKMESIHAMATSVERAHKRVEELRNKRSDSVLWTPLMRSKHWLELGSKPGSAPVYIKLESEQVTGSFKVRGALNRILCAGEASSGACPGPRIVTASTGNHAMAVAHALQLGGIAEGGERGCIFLPRGAKEAKVKALREYHQVVELTFTEGDDCLGAELAAKAFAQQASNAVYVSPCNDYEVISGQGTVAIEILETLRKVGRGIDPYANRGVIYVTVGGGGLITGVGSFLKARAAGWRVVGAQPQNSPVMHASVKAGRVVEMTSLPTLSDGSAGGLEQGKYPII
jgi:threonine dehydratase